MNKKIVLGVLLASLAGNVFADGKKQEELDGILTKNELTQNNELKNAITAARDEAVAAAEAKYKVDIPFYNAAGKLYKLSSGYKNGAAQVGTAVILMGAGVAVSQAINSLNGSGEEE